MDQARTDRSTAFGGGGGYRRASLAAWQEWVRLEGKSLAGEALGGTVAFSYLISRYNFLYQETKGHIIYMLLNKVVKTWLEGMHYEM